MQRLLVWAPRLLGIMFIIFLSLFALDVFDAGYGVWQTLLALVIHLIPVFVLLGGLAVAWRWGWFGSLVFLGFGLWYLVVSWGAFAWPIYAVIVGPSFLIGLLFLLDWWRRRSPLASL